MTRSCYPKNFGKYESLATSSIGESNVLIANILLALGILVSCHATGQATTLRTSLAMIVHRDDDAWIIDLTSEDMSVRSSAASDLRDMLLRGLAKSLSKQGRVDHAFLEDAVQEATIKILENLCNFEGRSKFRTWAVTIAVRTAFGKMRQRDWQNVSLDNMISNSEFDPQVAVDRSDTDSHTTDRLEMLNKLRDLITSELTQRQWVAITAELGGMPPPQIADKLGCNTNSIYKLMHDARKKLRHGLEASGYTIDELCEAWT